MKNLLTLLLLTLTLHASTNENFTYLQYDNYTFNNSKQKSDGARVTIHSKFSIDSKTLEVAYEKTNTKTYKPPLKSDLDVDKIYLKYQQKVFKTHKFHLGFITLKDNIVPTDGGKVFSFGYLFPVHKDIFFDTNYYYGSYNIMNTQELDISIHYKKAFGNLHTHIITQSKNIYIYDCNDQFCKNTDNAYNSAMLKIKLDYNEYLLHGAAFFGKRVFAVMMDGFLLQHHAMEFSKTYMLGVGKRFDNFELKMKYAYQEAKELPINNDNVEINALSLRMKYFY